MAQQSAIEWTHHTFNPWWGCTKVSQGCKHCYAETLSNRFGNDVWGPNKPRRFFDVKHWQEPLKWNDAAEKVGQRARVFCASMADVFEDNEQLANHRLRLWRLIEATPMLDWLLLTKRPENIRSMVPVHWLLHPPLNVWYGTSVENQAAVHTRIPHLLNVPAVVHFLSCEPLLEPVHIVPWLVREFYDTHDSKYGQSPRIDWVIAGGESGRSARPMHSDWVRSLRDQCEWAGVAFFFKQWGGVNKKATGRVLDGRTWDEFPQVDTEQVLLTTD